MTKETLLRLAVAAIASVSAGAASAQTQWIQDTMSEQCSAESRQQVADATRASIEESVARSEASIQPPAPVADLSCMNGLISADVDVFSDGWTDGGAFDPVSILTDMVGGLKSGLAVTTLAGGAERAICQFAKEKFETVNGGLSGSMNDIVGRTEGSVPSFTDGFGLMNINYNTGPAGAVPQPSVQQVPVNAGTTDEIQSQTEAEINSIWNSINGGGN